LTMFNRIIEASLALHHARENLLTGPSYVTYGY